MTVDFKLGHYPEFQPRLQGLTLFVYFTGLVPWYAQIVGNNSTGLR